MEALKENSWRDKPLMFTGRKMFQRQRRRNAKSSGERDALAQEQQRPGIVDRVVRHRATTVPYIR